MLSARRLAQGDPGLLAAIERSQRLLHRQPRLGRYRAFLGQLAITFGKRRAFAARYIAIDPIGACNRPPQSHSVIVRQDIGDGNQQGISDQKLAVSERLADRPGAM